jgi:hypothetical protein
MAVEVTLMGDGEGRDESGRTVRSRSCQLRVSHPYPEDSILRCVPGNQPTGSVNPHQQDVRARNPRVVGSACLEGKDGSSRRVLQRARAKLTRLGLIARVSHLKRR